MKIVSNAMENHYRHLFAQNLNLKEVNALYDNIEV